jgi:hypothetical protein
LDESTQEGLFELLHPPALRNQRNTSSLLAAKERRERIEIQGLFFVLLAFFCGQAALVSSINIHFTAI